MSNPPAKDNMVLIKRGQLWRRQFLAFALGGVVGAGGIIGTQVNGSEDFFVSGSNHTSTPHTPTPKPNHVQYFQSSMVDKIEFDDTGTMTIYLPEGHGTDSFGVWHQTDDVRDTNPVTTYGGLKAGGSQETVPRYAGTITVDVADAIQQMDVEFPSRFFKLVGYAGTGFDTDRVGVVVFEVPKPLMP